MVKDEEEETVCKIPSVRFVNSLYFQADKKW